MYRHFTKEEIIKHLTVYKCERELLKQELPAIKSYFDSPSLPLLMSILNSDSVSKEEKSAVLAALNTTLNYTSVKSILNNTSDLFLLLEDVDINPIYDYEQIKAIVSYIIHKSKNTNMVMKLQVDDVKNRLNKLGFKYEISLNGFTDIAWKDGKSSAKADGLIYTETEDIVVFLRYGSSTGGAQNDRYRGMFDMTRANPNRKFIFVCDGPEAFLQYDLAKDNLSDDSCKNGLWVTAKLLRFVDLDNFKILQFNN